MVLIPTKGSGVPRVKDCFTSIASKCDQKPTEKFFWKVWGHLEASDPEKGIGSSEGQNFSSIAYKCDQTPTENLF